MNFFFLIFKFLLITWLFILLCFHSPHFTSWICFSFQHSILLLEKTWCLQFPEYHSPKDITKVSRLHNAITLKNNQESYLSIILCQSHILASRKCSPFSSSWIQCPFMTQGSPSLLWVPTLSSLFFLMEIFPQPNYSCLYLHALSLQKPEIISSVMILFVR